MNPERTAASHSISKDIGQSVKAQARTFAFFELLALIVREERS